MDVFCGIDWAEDHHDIALADTGGQLLARRRIHAHVERERTDAWAQIGRIW